MVTKKSALEPKVRAFLAQPRYAVIATVNRDGSPQMTEIWYDLRGDQLIFNMTTERLKRRNLARDPRVSLLASTKKGAPAWDTLAYVRVDGRAREIATGDEGREDITRLTARYDGPEEAERLRPNWYKQDRVTYAIDIERVYAKGL
jgi:PPOX class probable F420-dependent enzyme